MLNIIDPIPHDPNVLGIWTVYDKTTTDFPGQYVARLHVTLTVGGLPAGGPTTAHMLTENVDEIRETLAAMGLHRMDRMTGDDPVILETWL